MILPMQYFDLKKKTIGTYGYEWADSDADTRNYLELNVMKFAHGKIDPSHFSISIEEKTNGKVISYFNILVNNILLGHH